jgi:gliding motility-associated lipoprotein GldD
VEEQSYNNPEEKVFANTWRLKGQQVASTFQFWATDSVKNFVRGAVYINSTPNYDSLEPVINYIQDDARHILETLKWK